MKIAILNNLYPPYERGGAEKIVARQIEELREAGHEVFLVTTRPVGSSLQPTEGGPRVVQVASRYFNLGDWPFFLRPFWHLANIFSWRKYREIKSILAREKPARIISHNLMGLGFMTPLAIRHLGLEHEHWLHDIQLLHPSGLMFWGREKRVDSLAARLYQTATRSFFASPARVVSPSNWLLNEHKKRQFFCKSEKVITSPSQLLPLARPERKMPSAAKNYLFVGQIETHKGILFLIDVFKKLRDPSIRLIIVGDGSRLREAENASALDSRILFRGRLSAAETKKAMSEADWLIVPSLCYENSPTVIREAQAVGLPVIATNLGGIPEMITPSDSLFRPDDSNELARRLGATA